MAPVRYRTAEADGFKVFYREAGNGAALNLLLLHGFPTAGRMFRDLIPLLSPFAPRCVARLIVYLKPEAPGARK